MSPRDRTRMQVQKCLLVLPMRFGWGLNAQPKNGGEALSHEAGNDDYFELTEARAFLRENWPSLLPCASLLARRRIRAKMWHQGVPEPEDVLHIVFEKLWSGARKIRRSIPARIQIMHAVDSVLSNLATSCENKCRLMPQDTPRNEEPSKDSWNFDMEDELAPSPDRNLLDYEESERLTGLLSSNELDRRVCRFILGREETSMRAFRGSVRPRAIARELGVDRQDIYKSFERLRIVFVGAVSNHRPHRF